VQSKCQFLARRRMSIASHTHLQAEIETAPYLKGTGSTRSPRRDGDIQKVSTRNTDGVAFSGFEHGFEHVNGKRRA
jgi:hypothetical protein